MQGEGRLTGAEERLRAHQRLQLAHAGIATRRYTSWTPEGEDIVGRRDSSRASIDALGGDHVVLTGGEPMLFAELIPLSAANCAPRTGTSRSKRPARSTCPWPAT